MPQQGADFSQGPFSAALLRPLAPEAAPITGHEGAAAAIGQVATNFLKGVAEQRARKFMQQEQQRLAGIQGLTGLMELSKQAGLTPAAHQEFVRNISRDLVSQVANADTGKPGDGEPGNPIMHFIKGLAVNLTGGQSPVKVKPIDQNTLGNYAQMLATLPKMDDVQKQMTSLMYEGQKEAYDRARAEGRPLMREELMQNSKIQEAMSLGQQHGIVPFGTGFNMMSESTMSMPKDAHGWMQYQDLFGQPQQGQGQPPTPGGNVQPATPPQSIVGVPGMPGLIAPVSAQAAPAATEPPTPPTATPQAPPVGQVATNVANAPGSPVRLNDTQERSLAAWNAFAKEPEQYMANNGKVFRGLTITDPLIARRNGLNAGDVVNVDTREVVHNAVKTGPVQQRSPERQHTPQEIAAFTSEMNDIVDKSSFPKDHKEDLKRSIAMHAKDGDFDGGRKLYDEYRNAYTRGDISRANSVIRINLAREAGMSGELTKPQAAAVKTYSAQWENNKTVQGYKQALMNYDQVKENLNKSFGKDSGIVQTEALRLFTRLTHPNQRVTDTEVKQYMSHLGILPKFEQLLKTGFTTGGWMTDRAKREFLDMADQVMIAQRKQYDQVRDKFTALARAHNVNPELITGKDYENANTSAGGGSEPPLTPNPKWNKPPTPQGKEVKF